MCGPYTPTVTVEVLYFEGCPSYKQVWSDLADVLTETKVDATVRLVDIDTLSKADTLPFGGSPTVRVNGDDIEGYEGQGVMACRVYSENEGKGWPSRRLLKRRLLEHVNGNQGGQQG